MTENWYILYTREGLEKEIFQLLFRKKIEAYLPLIKKDQPGRDLRRSLEIPLFKSYVFVKTDLNTATNLKSNAGILSIVYWLDSPLAIPDTEMETVKNFVARYKVKKAERLPVNANTVTSLNYCDAKGTELVGTSSQYIKLSFPLLGYSILAETETGKVRTIVKGKNATLQTQLSVKETASLVVK